MHKKRLNIIAHAHSRLFPPNASSRVSFFPCCHSREEKLAGAHHSSGQPPLRSLVLSQQYLQNEPMDLKTFAQNGIVKIQDLFPARQWRHVPSNLNSADLISRGVDPDKLLNQELWWDGPEFLSGSDYPNKTVKISENNDANNSELKNSVCEKI
ncbi:uncharacterized protein TNCV_2636201 [Trichonephila clavipes]|nr:uncharacterized protein TNCV_2636201 [Trichonephila clavipes]